MSDSPATQFVIDSALALPVERRLAVLGAIHSSLSEAGFDHGSADDAGAVAAEWRDEIERRLAEVDSGRVRTIPAEEAEQLIRAHEPKAL